MCIIFIMNSSEPDFNPGRQRRARAQGRHTEKLGEALAGLDPDLLDYADDFIFGKVWSRPELAFEDRMLVAIVALASIGNEQQLATYLHGALQDGMDAGRLREALKMLVVYVGFPTAIGALAVFDRVASKYSVTS